MGHQQFEQVALFYEFSLKQHVPPIIILRSIDRFVALGDLRRTCWTSSVARGDAR